ncbi:STM4015 family protein [Nocardiopsis sp. HUAS JQ3]|uniref:STM4015 family protein n=1 Tax=Nocardiopsis sp. HUAS JQ3 TaxID=3061629 RepID=UPI0023A9A7F4|nr:STM4015 family protein [Nocardiopsis sp. HUAS JQ3]WDZ90160.1 STM4015 family protein [Nocardiopsis sp. HUAS JQ3]
MLNHHHITEFAGLPVVDFPAIGAEDGPYAEDPHQPPEALAAAVADPGSVAWRLRVSSVYPAEDFGEYFARFLAAVDTGRVRALVVGGWGDFEDEPPSTVPRDALVAAADAFPGLRALFFGEIVQEEYEISWIHQSDLAPLVAAFPLLEELTVRGTGDPYLGDGKLELALAEHTGLRTLVLQTGGLPGRVSREVTASPLPALENLELWLGVESHRGDTTPDDLARVLSGEAFPELRYLGLRNAEDVNDWIPVLAQAPVLASLDVLDLSLGSLTDEGGQALIESASAFAGLRRLDLHYHYLSEDVQARIRAALPGVEVDLSGQRKPYTFGDKVFYFPAVAE